MELVGAIDEAVGLYQGPRTSDTEAVVNLLAELRLWCDDAGVDFADAVKLSEQKREVAA